MQTTPSVLEITEIGDEEPAQPVETQPVKQVEEPQTTTTQVTKVKKTKVISKKVFHLKCRYRTGLYEFNLGFGVTNIS